MAGKADDAENPLADLPVRELIDKLVDHCMGRLDPPLTNSQVRSIEVVLKKVLPDVSHLSQSGTLKYEVVDFAGKTA